jgi:phosphoglycerol transferase MdoB-like AlkP superfamily enzyme
LPPWFGRGRAALASLLYAALLVVPLRGGTQQIPVNQSDVYFSRIAFANHAALNAPWNLMSALVLRANEQPLAPFMPDSAARRLVAGLYPLAVGAAAPADSAAPVLTTSRPNVLFIILESFTAKLVGSVGGERGVTPNLDSLARTGILFDSIYAAGDRSQKGLVSLLSGYPNQPTTSIIKFPRKTENLPHLCRTLAAAGYSSGYYYGGELAFANMKSYLQTAGYEHLTERSDFAAADQNSKWGAHDGVLFNRVLSDLARQRQPFFVTAFTLSSHEPFDVPMKTRFPGQTEEDLFRNSVFYTDYALGEFLKKARQQPWYANTLLVLVADHGHILPGNSSNQSPQKFHIPLLLAGGAIRPENRGRVVSTIGSQTDVAATLLHQLRLPAADYVWSRDLLAPRAAPFAFYTFNNGFGVVSPAGIATYDNVSRNASERGAAVPDTQIRLGEALEQVSLADFARR